MRFEAKKDKRLIIPVFAVMLFGLGAIALSLVDILSQDLTQEAWIVIGSLSLFLAALVFIFSSIKNTYYELREDALYIKFGLIQQTIFYQDITEVKESKSWLSSLAWTFDRIAIYKKGRLSVLIGPVEKERFIKEIHRKINPPSIDF